MRLPKALERPLSTDRSGQFAASLGTSGIRATVPSPVSRRPLEPRPRIALDAECALQSETLPAEAGAYALTLSTNLRDLAVELHSSYVGHMRAETTHVAELVLGIGDPGAETSARKLRGVEVPLDHARRRCLIDHLERLQEILEEGGFGAARIDVGDETLLAVETGGARKN